MCSSMSKIGFIFILQKSNKSFDFAIVIDEVAIFREKAAERDEKSQIAKQPG